MGKGKRNKVGEAKSSLMQSQTDTLLQICVDLARAIRATREKLQLLDAEFDTELSNAETLGLELQKSLQIAEYGLIDFATSVFQDSGYEHLEQGGPAKNRMN